MKLIREYQNARTGKVTTQAENVNATSPIGMLMMGSIIRIEMTDKHGDTIIWTKE